jgi:multidrug resistance efflux pump
MGINTKYIKLLRFSLTFFVVAVAVIAGLALWDRYMDGAWTRDGRVRANIVMVAPDVGGLVSDVAVHDNEFVKKGQLLYKINEVRFEEALEGAEDIAAAKQANYEMKRQQYARRAQLADVALSQEARNDAKLELAAAKSAYEAAMMRVATAKLNLRRASVYAPVDGWVTNFMLRRGEYLSRGESHLSIVQKGSFWVYGYFEEHKIALLYKGERVQMRMLGSGYTLKGHIQGIARGITDRDNALGQKNLANVKPVFQWIRLAQRIPVRIHIDEIPKGFVLVAGMTCTVNALPAKGHDKEESMKRLLF